jgi:hypothetical protein
MFFYFGKAYRSLAAGGSVVGVVCDQCGCTYYYELARTGSGASTAPYWFGTLSAHQASQNQSETDLQRRLAREAELVPCPDCNWISEELVKGYRLGRYRGLGKFAFALALAGSILSLVVAWYLSIGVPVDRWAVPYVLIGGPGTFIAAAMLLLFLRAWLRSCCNRPNGSRQGFKQRFISWCCSPEISQSGLCGGCSRTANHRT